MDLKLPKTHPIWNIPDDLRLYQLIVAKLREGPIDDLDLTQWTYATARKERIPGEVVSKMLNAVRIYEGLRGTNFMPRRRKKKGV